MKKALKFLSNKWFGLINGSILLACYFFNIGGYIHLGVGIINVISFSICHLFDVMEGKKVEIKDNPEMCAVCKEKVATWRNNILLGTDDALCGDCFRKWYNGDFAEGEESEKH